MRILHVSSRCFHFDGDFFALKKDNEYTGIHMISEKTGDLLKFIPWISLPDDDSKVYYNEMFGLYVRLYTTDTVIYHRERYGRAKFQKATEPLYNP